MAMLLGNLRGRLLYISLIVGADAPSICPRGVVEQQVFDEACEAGAPGIEWKGSRLRKDAILT